MLVLSRKRGEELLAPQYGITLRILEIRGDQVRLGFTAPSEVQLFRGEVWARIQKVSAKDRNLLPPNGAVAANARAQTPSLSRFVREDL